MYTIYSIKKYEKGGERRTGTSKKNFGMGGVKDFTPGYGLNFFPSKRDKKEDI
jgi:hypothetical protein